MLISLDIEADSYRATEQIVRTVTENCKALKFKQHGFEAE
jgi:hypothetical protein